MRCFPYSSDDERGNIPYRRMVVSLIALIVAESPRI